MKKSTEIYTKWLMLPAVLIYTIFFIIPNISGLILAFTDWNVYFFDDFNFNGIDNFVRLFNEKIFWNAVNNTFYFAIITVIFKNLIGFGMALMVTKASKYNTYLRTVMFLPVTISGIVVSIIFVSIYNPTTGILNQFLNAVGLEVLAKGWLVDTKYAMTSIAAMEIWQWSGFSMVVFVAGIQSISQDYYEAAKIDGASRWQELRFITIPLMMQSFTITFIYSIISGLKVFAQVYGTTNGGPNNATQVMGTFLFKSFSNGHYGYSAAVGLVFMLMVMVVAGIILVVMRKKEVEF
ncbi:sugar ABC transporter permease [Sporanaerobium hydrogeniformans]|uniref:Sugar ABC transporter permease n=1 Tax=Sporanaerobium hydrogeniformans TaxID=3072179 RepID=A0AC61DGD3_9FIRM|nr:sugar ABC transporter permease [Sporanaerobium hydrogeniformans]PHV72256.1 sugar ABC transporter permease [Sporanaerobium hydrogeniformans]